jgi:hypothetical protein
MGKKKNFGSIWEKVLQNEALKFLTMVRERMREREEGKGREGEGEGRGERKGRRDGGRVEKICANEDYGGLLSENPDLILSTLAVRICANYLLVVPLFPHLLNVV